MQILGSSENHFFGRLISMWPNDNTSNIDCDYMFGKMGLKVKLRVK